MINLAILIVDVLAFAVFRLSPASRNPLKQVVGTGIVVISVAAFFIFNYWFFSVLLSNMPRKEKVPAFGKEDYRETLKRYRILKPALAGEIDRASTQMDSIDRKKDKLYEVMNRNGTVYKSLVETGDETQEVLYQNIRYVANRVTIWDEKEYNNPQKTHLYEDHLKKIRQVLNKNEEILTEFDVFLTEVSALNSAVVQNDDRLEAMIKALRDHYSDSGKYDQGLNYDKNNSRKLDA